MILGRFITLEGGEGTGKSTQAKVLAGRLRGRGLRVLETREPGGTPLGESVRDLILGNAPAEPTAEFLLFAAARAEHVTTVIGPALRDRDWVVCDRFMDSTRVYQGDVWNVDRALIAATEKATVDPYFPHLTIVLDVPVETARARTSSRGLMNRYDAARAETYDIIRAGFLKIAAAEPARCIIVDADRSSEDVAEHIWKAVSERLFPVAV